MPTDLNERLANYRTALDDAIAADLANRSPRRIHRHPHTRRVLAKASAVVVVAAGIGALVWTNTDRSSTPATTAALTDRPATTINDPVEPEPTSAAVSVAPAPPATAPPDSRIARLALGDSVMLGAADELSEGGFTVDARVTTTYHDLIATAETLRDRQRLGDVVVVHLGANGPISETDMASVIDALSEVPHVLLLTIDVPLDYAADNNNLIHDTATVYPNVSVLDWAALNDACPGNCFYSDGIHLRPDGHRYYADLINAAVDGRYHVQVGDYPYLVAEMFCTTISELTAANGWTDANEFPAPDFTIVVPRPINRSTCPEP